MVRVSDPSGVNLLKTLSDCKGEHAHMGRKRACRPKQSATHAPHTSHRHAPEQPTHPDYQPYQPYPTLSPGGRGKAPEAFGFEAKEFVRSRCVGKKVKVVFEYERGTSCYVSVFLSNNVNLGEALLGAGLAETLRHRSDEGRSKHFARLLEAEASAEQKKVGKHAKGPQGKAMVIVDLTDR